MFGRVGLRDAHLDNKERLNAKCALLYGRRNGACCRLRGFAMTSCKFVGVIAIAVATLYDIMGVQRSGQDGLYDVLMP